MENKQPKEMQLNYKRTFLLGVVFLSISILNGAHDNMTSKILFDQFAFNDFWRNFIMAIDNMLAVFMLPIFGKLSDACDHKWGKRKPFVFWGTVAAVVFLLLFPVALEANNPVLFIIFICFFLVALGVYRSAGVALVADVTIKPLRSKANAVINLMGAVAFILGAVFTMVFYKDIDPATGVRSVPIFAAYVAYAAVALICLFLYMKFIPEKKWTLEREQLEAELKIEDEDLIEDGVNVKLTKDHLKSLLLVLTSIVLWTCGYNAVTTNYSVYADVVLGIKDGGFAGPTLIAGISGFASYFAVGWAATKFGRRKTIMAGLLLAVLSFGIAIFARSGILMYVVFVLVGIAQAAIIVNTLPMVVEFSNKKTIGQFTGYYYIATQAAQALSPLIIGLIMLLLNRNDPTETAGISALFPYGTIFVAAAFVPLIFVKYGDAKAVPKASVLEMLDVDD